MTRLSPEREAHIRAKYCGHLDVGKLLAELDAVRVERDEAREELTRFHDEGRFCGQCKALQDQVQHLLLERAEALAGKPIRLSDTEARLAARLSKDQAKLRAAEARALVAEAQVAAMREALSKPDLWQTRVENALAASDAGKMAKDVK